MLPADSSLPNNPARMASPDQQDAQSQPLQQQHNPQAHQLDLTSDFSTEGSVSTQPHQSQQTLASDSFHRPSLTRASLDQLFQRPGHQHPPAVDTQLPNVLPQAVDNVDLRAAVVSRPPYPDFEYGATLEDAVPGISDEEVKDIRAWVEKDRVSIVLPERPEGDEGNATEGFEAQGKAESCEEDDLMYEQQQSKAVMLPSSDELLAEMRMEHEIGHGENEKEAIIPKENTLQDSEKAEQPIPIRTELGFENYRLSETIKWNANDLALSPATFVAPTCLDFGIPLTARPLIIKRVQDQLAEYRVHHGHNVPSPTAKSIKEQPSSILDRRTRQAKGDGDVRWGLWRERLRHGEADVSVWRANQAGVGDLKHQEPLVSVNEEVRDDTEMIDMGAGPTKDVVSMHLQRVSIKLDITVGSMRLVDRFEWDTSTELNSPESFAECYTNELGLGSEFKAAIARGIRRQVQMYMHALLRVGHQFDGSIVQDKEMHGAAPNPAVTATCDAKQATEFMPILHNIGGEINHQAERKQDKYESPEAATVCGVDAPGREPVEAIEERPEGVDTRLYTIPAIEQVNLLSGNRDKLAARKHDQFTPQLQTIACSGSPAALPSPVAQHDTNHEANSAKHLPQSTMIKLVCESMGTTVPHEFECTTHGSAGTAIIQNEGPEGEPSCKDETVYGSDFQGSTSLGKEGHASLKQTPQPQSVTPGKKNLTPPLSSENGTSPTESDDWDDRVDDSDGGNKMASLFDLANDLQTRFMQKGDSGDLDNVIRCHHQALGLYPPGHPNYPGFLNNLACAFQTRFEQKGNLGDLDNAIKYHHQALDLHPPGHPNPSTSLNNLASALQTRFQQKGDFGDLDNAIKYHHQVLDLCSPSHPDHSMSLNNLAIALDIRFEQKGDFEDLNNAIKYYHQVLDLCPPGHPNRFASLNNLAGVLQIRFLQKGDFGDLDNAIKYHHQALHLCPPGHPFHSSSLNNLASVLHTRFEQKGDFGDLDNAIKYNHQVLDLCPPGHSNHFTSLSNLASALKTRFLQKGDFGDLDNAIKYHHQALDLCSPGQPDHSTCLNNLANALITRFLQKGDFGDLDNAIKYHHQALDLRPPSHPYHSASLNNLAGVLEIRFLQKGDFGDLDNAIKYHHQALDLRPPSHPYHSTSLNNLARALCRRFEQKGDFGDLDNAIKYHHQVLDLCPPGHPNHSMSLTNLANALQIRFQQKGDFGGLDNGIKYHRQALELCPPGHPDHPMSLNNFAGALQIRFLQKGDFGDLDNAIKYLHQALDLCPPNHPGHSMSLKNLANTLCTRFKQGGDLKDLNSAINLYKGAQAIPFHHPYQLQLAQGHAMAYLLHPNVQHHLDDIFSLYQKAADHVPGGSKAQLLASLDWITSAKQHLHTSEILAYSTSLGLLQKYLTLHPTILSQLSALTRMPLTLGSDATACAIKAGQLSTSLEFLEQGRAVLWKNLEGYGTSLQDLQDRGHQDLAQEFQRLGHLLEHTTLSSMKTIQQPEQSLDDQSHRYYQLSQEWHQVTEQIQRLPGFSHFLKPIPFQTLQLSASKGPVIVVNISEYHSDAIVLSNTSDPIHVTLPSATWKDITLLSIKLKHILKAPQEEGSLEHAKGVIGVLRSLWSWVVEPIVAHLDWLPQGSHIWWCPTSTLCSLPLHAAGPWKKGKLNLPDMFLSSYTPTLSALQRVHTHTHPPHVTPSILAVGVSELAGGLRNLESVKEDIHEVVQAAAFKCQHVDVLDGEKACKDAVLSGLKQHSWVHFACHGHQDFNEPFKSSFSLYDMPLTLHDIIQAKIPNAELAFLSACHSASADQVAPDETIHLAAALQYSGFKTVIGTLWAMDDRDGPDVAKSFYKYMFRNGKGNVDHRDAAEALKHVVDTLRKKGVSVDRWACFVHIGA